VLSPRRSGASGAAISLLLATGRAASPVLLPKIVVIGPFLGDANDGHQRRTDDHVERH
jgi:hypothetical protein